MKDYTLEKRKYVIGAAAIVIVLIYVFRLFDLQIMTDDYKKNADSNAFLNKIQYPSRGAIYDRNGKLLVFNQPAYDITFVPREVTQLDTLDLCSALNITREQFDKRMKDVKNRWMNPGYSKYTHQVFMTQLSAEECGVFQEKLFKFPGFYIQRRTIRQYTYNSAGHLLGDIGEVSKKDIENDDYYIRGDYIGKQGIEKSYEKYLRGEKGVEILLRDAHGRIQGHYMDGQLDRSSVPGKNLTLGIDIDLQMLGERLLQHKIGAIVAIEPATGEILCMVYSPTFDPHLMIGRQRGKNHRLLQMDKRKPLLNRAIMGAYPPGSTFKTAQALTFLQEEIIHEDYPTFPCAHGFNHKGLHVGCHGHGSPLSLIPAIATSCNSYFCWGLYRMFGDKKYGSPQNAITVWKDHMVSQGFGYRLGTDLPGEQRGLIPNAKFYDKPFASAVAFFEATLEIVECMVSSFIHGDKEMAFRVDPLADVISQVKKAIRRNHNKRLEKGKCSVELGMALTDMVTSLERIARHCSNIAEEQMASETDQYALHQYARDVKERNELYRELLEGYTEKYSLEKT